MRAQANQQTNPKTYDDLSKRTFELRIYYANMAPILRPQGLLKETLLVNQNKRGGESIAMRYKQIAWIGRSLFLYIIENEWLYSVNQQCCLVGRWVCFVGQWCCLGFRCCL